MAGHPVVGFDFQERGNLDGAGLEFVRAAGVEIAPRRRIDGAGNLPLQNDSLPLQGRVRYGVGGEQRLRIRVFGVAGKIVAHGQLGNPPQMHDAHPVADMLDHMKVVGEMIQGKREFAADAVKTAGKAIAGHADEFPHKFPEGSIEGPSEALHSIWQDWETFLRLSGELKVTALAMADAADTAADASGIRPHFSAVGKTCSECHQGFRKRN